MRITTAVTLKRFLINYNQTKKLLNALFACIKSIFLSKEDILLKFKDNIFLNKTYFLNFFKINKIIHSKITFIKIISL